MRQKRIGQVLGQKAYLAIRCDLIFKKVFLYYFGQRATKDAEFNRIYKIEKNLFCKRILEDDAFAKQYGELGNVYGSQWRNWKTSQGKTIDQLKDVIEMIKTNPDSRRLIVTAWNPEDVPTVALPPCHTLFQFYVADGTKEAQIYF